MTRSIFDRYQEVFGGNPEALKRGWEAIVKTDQAFVERLKHFFSPAGTRMSDPKTFPAQSRNTKLTPEQKHNELRLTILRPTPEILAMSPEQCLQCAIQAEETAKAVGPFDMAYETFTRQKQQWEKLAEIQEKRATYLDKLTETGDQ